MADRTPVKILPDDGSDSTGLGEFIAADTIGIVDGGTGLATVAADNILTGNGTSALTAESNLKFDSSNVLSIGSNVTIRAGAPTAGNDATMGYSAGDGLVLLGQGTGTDVMLKNDAAQAVLSIPTGTQTVAIGRSTSVTSGFVCEINIGASNDNNLFLNATDAWNPKLSWGDGGVETSGIEYDSSTGVQALKFFCDGNSGGGPTERMRIDSSGAVTKPTNPHLFAKKNNRQENATGDGTLVTISFPEEFVDQGADFDGTTFTAPVTGQYLVCVAVWIESLSSHEILALYIVSSNRSVNVINDPDVPDGHGTWAGSMVMECDASDTIVAKISVAGGTQTVDIAEAGYISITLVT